MGTEGDIPMTDQNQNKQAQQNQNPGQKPGQQQGGGQKPGQQQSGGQKPGQPVDQRDKIDPDHKMGNDNTGYSGGT
jgi:hypothetical protein